MPLTSKERDKKHVGKRNEYYKKWRETSPKYKEYYKLPETLERKKLWRLKDKYGDYAEAVVLFKKLMKEKVLLKCANCGKMFLLPYGDYRTQLKKRINNFYCSRDCYRLGASKNWRQ